MVGPQPRRLEAGGFALELGPGYWISFVEHSADAGELTGDQLDFFRFDCVRVWMKFPHRAPMSCLNCDSGPAREVWRSSNSLRSASMMLRTSGPDAASVSIFGKTSST